MKPDRALIVGMACGLLVSILVGSMMLDNNNQGEFADTVSGKWTPHFWQSLAIYFGVVTAIVSGILALIGKTGKSDD